MRYHMREDGTPGECSATQRDCPLGGVEHGDFNSPAEAQAWAEEVNLQRAGGSMFSAPEQKVAEGFALPDGERVDKYRLRALIRKKDSDRVEIYGVDMTERGISFNTLDDHPGLEDIASDDDEAFTLLNQAEHALEVRKKNGYNAKTDSEMVYAIIDSHDFYETLNNEDPKGAEKGKAVISKIQKEGPELGISVILVEEISETPRNLNYPTEIVRRISADVWYESKSRKIKEYGAPRSIAMEEISKSPSFERSKESDMLYPRGRGRFFRADGREVSRIEYAPGSIQAAIHYAGAGVEPDLISADIPQDLFYVR